MTQTIEQRLAELERFREDFLAGAYPGKTALGPGSIGARALKARTLNAVSGKVGTLIVQEGGTIQDPDGKALFTPASSDSGASVSIQATHAPNVAAIRALADADGAAVDVNPQANITLVNMAVEIAGGEVSCAGSFNALTTPVTWLTVATSGGADDLDTISDGREGQIVILVAADAASDPVTVVSGSDNISLKGGNCVLNAANATLTLLYNGTDWLELARA